MPVCEISQNPAPLSHRDFATLIGVNRRTVDRWAERGVLSLAPNSRVNVAESLAALAARPKHYRGGTTAIGPRQLARPSLAEPEPPSSVAPSPNGEAFATHAEALRVKESFLAHLRRLEFEKKSASLAPVEIAVQIIAEECAAIRTAFRQLAPRVAPRLAELSDPERCRDLIDAGINEILEELSGEK